MAYKYLGVVALVALQISTSLACDDYELVISNIDKCPGVVSIVNFDNFNVSLTNDCKVVPHGKISYGSFNTAKVEVDITFKGRKERRIQRTVDFCSRMKNMPPAISDVLKAKNLSTSCPITGKSITTDGMQVDITKYKQFLGLGVGNVYGQIKTTYDTGVSCYTFNSTLKLRDGAPKKTINRLEVMKGLRDLIGGKSGGGGGGGAGGGFNFGGKKWWKKGSQTS